jgi:hypothetical protein
MIKEIQDVFKLSAIGIVAIVLIIITAIEHGIDGVVLKSGEGLIAGIVSGFVWYKIKCLRETKNTERKNNAS